MPSFIATAAPSKVARTSVVDQSDGPREFKCLYGYSVDENLAVVGGSVTARVWQEKFEESQLGARITSSDFQPCTVAEMGSHERPTLPERPNGGCEKGSHTLTTNIICAVACSG